MPAATVEELGEALELALAAGEAAAADADELRHTLSQSQERGAWHSSV